MALQDGRPSESYIYSATAATPGENSFSRLVLSPFFVSPDVGLERVARIIAGSSHDYDS